MLAESTELGQVLVSFLFHILKVIQLTKKETRIEKLKRINQIPASGADVSGHHKKTTNKIRFRFKIVTPAVIGGADNKRGAAELRIQSIMGAVRFWWRALAWHRALAENPTAPLRTVQNWQQKLFGGTLDRKNKSEVIPKIFTVQLSNLEAIQSRPCGPPNCGYPNARFVGGRGDYQKSGQGLAYLAGLGLKQNNKRTPELSYERQALQPGGTFELVFTMRVLDSFQSESAKVEAARRRHLLFERSQSGCPTLPDAIWLLTLLGGVGARWRRGFGGLQLQSVLPSVPSLVPIRTWEAHKQALKEIWEVLKDDKSLADDIPYTALSSLSEFVVAEQGKPSAGNSQIPMHEFHNETGMDFLQFRSNGNGSREKNGVRYRTVEGRRLERGDEVTPKVAGITRFWEDHETFYQASNGKHSGLTIPKRAAFGLPHNYFKPGMRQRNIQPRILSLPEAKKTGDDEKAGKVVRRASALMLTIRDYEDGPGAVWSALYAKYLDVQEIAAVNGDRERVNFQVPPSNEIWRPINQFMQRLRGSPAKGTYLGKYK